MVTKQLLDEHARNSSSLAAQQVQVQAATAKLSTLARQKEQLSQEVESVEAEGQSVQAQLDSIRSELIALEARLAQSQAAIQQGESQLDQLESLRTEHSQDAIVAKVELAKAEQQLETLQARMVQFEDDQRERSRAIMDASQQVTQCLERIRQTESDILQSTSALAELYLAKEDSRRQIAQQQTLREAWSAQRAQWTSQIQTHRKRLQQLEDQLHKKELATQDLRHQRSSLEQRLRDDYGIEVAQLMEQANATDQATREQIENEISDLRSKLSHIGSVNLEALAELDELEARYNALNGQFQDLVQAKESLERIIQRINADSRRLFQDTLEAIRANFQTLYRRAFGGGRADIVLEEGVDPLEAGVELLATPPGKPQFNNSLLSGGEKALTAVALLLAIFQFRPSPFCVLDEVDAPFDEANIGRFVEVLKGFLGWTKFVIVTHSKKTMTAATTLYGVTMQESGVSKRVSVRFEDVSEDGQISPDAVQRDDRKAA
jgi:chromosome segregation protein